MRIALLFLAIFSFSNLFGQDTREKLADQYFQNGEFEKAAPVYLELAESKTDNLHAYNRYVECAIELKQFEPALKLIKKRKRKLKDARYSVDEGFVLNEQGKTDEANEVWENIIKNLPADATQIGYTARLFEAKLEYEYAIETYQKGEELMGPNADFSQRLAMLYMQSGSREMGIQKYLDLVANSGLPYEQARQLMEMNITDSLDFVVLRKLLLKKIQTAPENYLLTDLLTWTFIKQKDWQSAFIQTRSLDKRLNEKGERMLELGALCSADNDWANANRCFDYIISLGESEPYYLQALTAGIETRGIMLSETSPLQNDPQLIQLLVDCDAVLTKYSLSRETWKVIKTEAHLLTQVTHETDKAIDRLEAFISTSGVGAKLLAEAKLLLGDAYVMNDDVWSSELLYAQVEKDFPEEPIGQEAKFRRARLSYYRGNFDWAVIQLDALKGATTQLISNNAMELALTIAENLGIDSNYQALEMYAAAELLVSQQKFDAAELLMDSIPILFPGHSLTDDILYQRAVMKEKQGNYEKAAELYNTLGIAFAHDILADNAWFALGLLYENKLNNPDKAKEAFGKIVFDFPGSLFNAEARRHYRKLRGDGV